MIIVIFISTWLTQREERSSTNAHLKVISKHLSALIAALGTKWTRACSIEILTRSLQSTYPLGSPWVRGDTVTWLQESLIKEKAGKESSFVLTSKHLSLPKVFSTPFPVLSLLTRYPTLDLQPSKWHWVQVPMLKEYVDKSRPLSCRETCDILMVKMRMT